MAGLRTYRVKRDFARTREPRGGKATARRRTGYSFVVQKHAARRLHYDFRLELDGVLKSWAVTRGPSLVPGEKRLAVEVEDHPIEYAGFEGTIPKGEYGGGSVIVWDRGRWIPAADPHQGLAKGHLDFTLEGEKLRGRWHLVRMQRRRSEKHDNWLLIKGDDESARDESEADILEEQPESVLSGQRVEDIGDNPKARVWHSNRKQASEKSREAAKEKSSPRRNLKAAVNSVALKRMPPDPAKTSAPVATTDLSRIKGARKAKLPEFVAPCLATLVPNPPAGARWVHEIKFDGYRLQARIASGKVRLLTRTGLDWTDKFDDAIVAALAALPVREALIDGEVVVENEAGASDFAALQAALSEGRGERLVFYAFDLLHADGYDLRGTPLIARKRVLGDVLAERRDGPLRFSEHFEQNGDLVLQHACRLSLEGIVSKLANAPYHSGRGKDWLKSKCSARQEFVIAGLVPSTTSRRAVGSLVLGLYERGKLIYAGRVGTGFSAKVARDLYRKLEAMRIEKIPFAQKLKSEETRDVHWVRPELVAEVEFRGWTGAHILRHASFHGLREDKPAEQIVREDTDGDAGSKPKAGRATFGVKLTHPDRIYWADAGVTKEGLANYYADVWKWIAPHIVARPLALVRCPDGASKECFFQKQPWKGMHASIVVIENPGAGGGQVLAIQDLDGLIGLVQAGTLEIHPWGSTVGDLDHPDRLIFDLDPGPGVPWSGVVEAAFEMRRRLDDVGLKSFVKTTGGKGLHVVAPLVPQANWDVAKAFTRDIAVAMAQERPDRYVATMAKKERKGRIFIDYLRNGRGATAIVPYGTRARAGAPVAMPLAWEELGSDGSGDQFRVTKVMHRLAHLHADPWAGLFKVRQMLPENGAGRRRKRRQ